MELMGALMRGGMLTSRPVHIAGVEVPAAEAISALLWKNPVSKENPVWAYGLVVEVLGEKGGRRTRCTYRSAHPPQEEWGGESAYFKNVGVPLAIGAELIASGQVSARGVVPPERSLPVDPFFEALAQRGITVEETIVEEGKLA